MINYKYRKDCNCKKCVNHFDTIKFHEAMDKLSIPERIIVNNFYSKYTAGQIYLTALICGLGFIAIMFEILFFMVI